MASCLTAACLYPAPQEACNKPVGVCMAKCSGCRIAAGASSPAFRRRRSASMCSQPGTTPTLGFGLARSRSTGARCTDCKPLRNGTRSANWLCHVRDRVQVTVLESKERLRSTREECVKVLQPPSQLRAAWHRQQPVPRWVWWICVLGHVASVLFLIASFTGIPSSDCPSGLAQKANVLLLAALTFAAGALLAVDEPVKWAMLRAL
jgi:hypothetical protein